MKCALCGYEFSEKESVSTCKNCPLHKGCELIKCPNCGYEWPKEPEWIKKLGRT
ncbi:MAG: hypothetical protein AABY84_12010 [Candidatus Firestonebacteria bacterium]